VTRPGKRRASGALVVALVVVLVAFALLAPLVAPALAGRPNAADLEAEIVCPVCKTTLDMSNAEIAVRMKGYIRQRIDEGATAKEIKDELVDQFGAAVLAEPAKHGFDLLAWVLPIGGGAVGALALGLTARAWSRRGGLAVPGGETPLDAGLERRVDEALGEFEELEA
jgi:cytochrome c-type biogenesis protein CcmH